MDVNTLKLKLKVSTLNSLFHFISNVLRNRPEIMKMSLIFLTALLHYLLLLCWMLLHNKGSVLWCTELHQPNCSRSAILHMGLNLWKISPVFLARSDRLMQEPFKVIFFIGKLQMKCMPQKQFHLSPNEAFTDSVSKLWRNKLLPANINEICSLIAKQVNLSMTVFHDQVHGKRLSQSFMQQEGSSDTLWLAEYQKWQL